MEFTEIIKLIQTVSESGLESFSMEQGDFKVNMKNKEFSTEIVERVQIAEEKTDCKEIVSPLVGTFYTAKSDNSEPFIKIGDEVKEGQVIGIIEAMKIMNEVTACVSGTVENILVENEQLVEYGQSLVQVRPDKCQG